MLTRIFLKPIISNNKLISMSEDPEKKKHQQSNLRREQLKILFIYIYVFIHMLILKCITRNTELQIVV